MQQAFSGLRARLLAMVLLALVPATILMVSYAAFQVRTAEQRTREDVRRLADSDARSLQALISQARASLATFASSQAIQTQDWSTAQATAERIVAEQPEYLNVGVLSPDGGVLVSGLPSTSAVNVSDRSYFQRAMEYRRFAVGDFQIGRVSGRPSVNVAYPVLLPDGSVQSVLYLSLDVQEMSDRMVAASSGSPFWEYLTDSMGAVVARVPDVAGAQGSPLPDANLRSALRSNQSGLMSSSTTNGVAVEYAYRPVFSEPHGGLFLSIGFAHSELFAEDDNALRMALAGFAAVMLAALAVAWIAGTRWVYAPISQLREAAVKIGSGRLSERAGLRAGTVEFSDLGREFDSMAESIERRAALDHALSQVNRLAHSTLDFDEVIQRIISVTCDAVGAETAAIVMRENGLWRTKYSYNFDRDIIGVVLTDAQAPHAALALKSGHPVAIDDGANDPRVNSEVLSAYGIRSVLTMPLIEQGEVIGAMFMNHHQATVEFTSAQVDFAESVAATVSSALHNARLYEGEHRVAETLQLSLLALPERIPHLRFANIYQSATETVRVGGDFYDLFEVERGLIGVVVGDMSGKGLDAAALTSLVKNTIRAQAVDQFRTPAGVMEAVNRALLRGSSPEIFATVFLGVLDIESGRLVYCNAGHTTGAIVRRGGGVTGLPSNSPLVGAFSEAAFRDSAAEVGQDDLLFLYTDGLTEARGEDGLFGEARVFAILEGLHVDDPSVVANQVLKEATAHAGGHLSDDLAILAVRRADG